jgi:hypothetical protein
MQIVSNTLQLYKKTRGVCCGFRGSRVNLLSNYPLTPFASFQVRATEIFKGALMNA